MMFIRARKLNFYTLSELSFSKEARRYGKSTKRHALFKKICVFLRVFSVMFGF